jgi:imidazole glycerol-phosphate synthase subunit HisH
MIHILDYGAGNLKSLSNALEKLETEFVIVKDLLNISKANGLIIPGVGSFETGISHIEPFKDQLKELKIPILGICLGLQLFASSSDEGGQFIGLNMVPGKVVKFDVNLKIPQMGWNRIKILKETPLLKGVQSGDYFYFVHSYHIVPENKEDTIATTDYGYDFASIITNNKNVYATQFHPERSGTIGLKILQNFIDMTEVKE